MNADWRYVQMITKLGSEIKPVTGVNQQSISACLISVDLMMSISIIYTTTGTYRIRSIGSVSSSPR